MSGHNKWSQIKHQKAATDAKRGQAFSKLSKMITIAAREGGANPDANVKLRDAITKAKQANMSSDNIQRAIKKGAGGQGEGLESFLYEAYGPGGVALLIEGATDNRNRSTNEIKHLLSERDAKWAEPGSVRWAFTRTEQGPASPTNRGESQSGWEAQEHGKISLDREDKKKLDILLETLNEHEDVEKIYSNIK